MKNLNIFAILNFFFVKSNLLKVKNCKTATFSRIFRGKKINKFKNFSPKKFKNFHVFWKKKIRQLFSWNRNFKGKIDNFTIYKENISTIFSKKSFDFWAKNDNFEQCDILLLSELQTLKNRKNLSFCYYCRKIRILARAQSLCFVYRKSVSGELTNVRILKNLKIRPQTSQKDGSWRGRQFRYFVCLFAFLIIWQFSSQKFDEFFVQFLKVCTISWRKKSLTDQWRSKKLWRSSMDVSFMPFRPLRDTC